MKRIQSIKTVSELLSRDDVTYCLSEVEKYRANLRAMVVIGLDTNGDIYIAGSRIASGEALILLKKAEHKIINDCELDEEID